MNPTITVLTPVYNGERYLAECIESVRAQTRTDWEYVIVDNCSTDRTAEIAEHYASMDSRIRVVRCTEFVNVFRSFCRTLEYLNPASRYCKFVCADDWLYPECLEKMTAVAEKHPSVGFVSAFRLIDKRVDSDGLVPYTDDFMSGREAVRRALLDGIYVTGSQTNLLFSAEAVRKRTPFFDEAEWHSDTDAGLRTLLDSDLGFVHQVLTFCREHPDTLSERYTSRINTPTPFFLDMVIRYGPKVLTQEEYRYAVRNHLRQYGWFLFKAWLKPARRKDKTFQSFHSGQVRRMLAELSREDRETRWILKSMQALVSSRNGKFAIP